MSIEVLDTAADRVTEDLSSVVKSGLIYLLPEDIHDDAITNVRPFSSSTVETQEELREIQSLADSMASPAGQVEPVIVRRNDDNTYSLIAGSRRRKAAAIINMGRGEGEVPFYLSALVDNETPSDVVSLQKALVENIHRRSISPMDLAFDIQMIRERLGLKGKAGTKGVAEFIGVSPATVTQHEKLLTLEPKYQLMIHEGRISAQAAQDLADVKPGKRAETLAKAQELQAAAIAQPKSGKGKGGGARDTGKLQQTHVRKATRETATPGDGTPVKALSRTEIVGYFEAMINAPAYGHPDGAIRKFAKYFVEEFAAGKGSERTMDAKFDEMTKDAYKGTKEASDKLAAQIKAEEDKETAARAVKTKPKPVKPVKKVAPPAKKKKENRK